MRKELVYDIQFQMDVYNINSVKRIITESYPIAIYNMVIDIPVYHLFPSFIALICQTLVT